jgi:hypothetical protein
MVAEPLPSASIFSMKARRPFTSKPMWVEHTPTAGSLRGVGLGKPEAATRDVHERTPKAFRYASEIL